jgi:hypothetical protein
VVFVGTVGDLNAIGTLRKQVDSWRTKQRDVRGIDDAFQRRITSPKKDDELQLVRIELPGHARQIGQLNEPESLRKAEVLLHQSVTLKRSQGDWQQGFGIGKSDGTDGLRGQRLVPPRTDFAGNHKNADPSRETQFVQLIRDVAAAAKVQRQSINARLRKFQPRRRAQANTQPPFDTVRVRQLRKWEVRRKGKIYGGGDFEWP